MFYYTVIWIFVILACNIKTTELK